jgi:GNAT superfamily N-acetyltransferase
VAVTCHYDVLPWLEPDWHVDMATGTLHRRRLRRPRIELEVFRCERSAWRLFAPHHYLSGSLPPGAVCYLASWNDAPAAFCAVLAVPGRAGERRVSRIVVLPDYQGVGVGRAFLNAVAELHAAQGQLLRITTSHPAMIAALARSPDWRLTAVKKSGYGVQSGARRGRLNNYVQGVSLGRGVVSFLHKAAVGKRKAALPR